MSNLDDFLAHHGVKGMKWGRRKKDDTVGSSPGGSSKESTPKSKSSAPTGPPKSTKAKAKPSDKDDSMSKALDDFYKNKTDKQLNAEGKKKLKEQANQTFPSKGDSKNPKKAPSGEADVTGSDVKEGRLSRKQKIALGVGAAVVVGGLAVYGNKKIGDLVATQEASKRLLDQELGSLFGSNMPPKPFPTSPPTFYQGLKTKRALDRPEFTIPGSTIFQRLSDHQETGQGYNKGAYATFLSNDKAAYGSSGEFGFKKYTLTFQPTGDVRVPATRTVLESLKEVAGEQGRRMSDQQAIQEYHAMSGGSWKTETSAALIENLKKKGYSAIVDDMDAGYLGDLPVVFFGDTKQVTATPRDKSDVTADILKRVPMSSPYA
ncbi:hypothetical protein SEA_MOSSY_16 [Gordonia phage Mossy]|nr:hypothetical protein SEA_MOSSY_16 [Gordonia phage Mossy]